MKLVFFLTIFMTTAQPILASFPDYENEDHRPRRGSIAHLMGWTGISIDTTSSEEEDERQPLQPSASYTGVSKCCCVTSVIATSLLLSAATGVAVYCSLTECF